MRLRQPTMPSSAQLIAVTLCISLTGFAVLALAQQDAPEAVTMRLLDRAPFDRVTLNDTHGNSVLETQLLEFPNRRVPTPFPESGSLELRLIQQPSVPYTLSWTAIESIDLFEQLLMAEAERLTESGEFAEAFEYFSFLRRHYPQLPGLEVALQRHLWRDAIDAFNRNEAEDALPALMSLHDLNPSYPRIVNAVQSVSGALIESRWQSGDVAGARSAVETVARAFPDMSLPSIALWQRRFQTDAQQQLEAAKQSLAAGQYDAARKAIQRAEAILPAIAGAKELRLEIHRTAPEFRVAVTATGEHVDDRVALDWTNTRIDRLLNPRLVEEIGFGAEGGVYRCEWADVEASDAGQITTLTFSQMAVRSGILPERLALQLIDGSRRDNASTDDLARFVDRVDLLDGDAVRITWRRPHVRPESLLRTPLSSIVAGGQTTGAWTASMAEAEGEVRFRPTTIDDASTDGASNAANVTVVEKTYSDDELAVAALIGGDVDVLERAPPWRLDQLRNARGIRVERYRLPTVHVLLFNSTNALFDNREFRRALCYAIDREMIVRDLLLAGTSHPGFRVLSAPMLAGESLTDPVGYAYAAEIQPRPYEPRLGTVLVNVAREAIKNRHRTIPIDESDSNSEDAGDDDATLIEPLVLAHPPGPIARMTCRAIKLQLDYVGVPVELLELPTTSRRADQHFDLLYCELAVTEPLVDLRRILGEGGIAGRTSAIMSLRLGELEQATSWNEVQDRTREIHRVAHDELPVIPLWQTVNHFAYRDWLQGIGEEPLTLYQNVREWRKSFDEGRQ